MRLDFAFGKRNSTIRTVSDIMAYFLQKLVAAEVKEKLPRISPFVIGAHGTNRTHSGTFYIWFVLCSAHSLLSLKISLWITQYTFSLWNIFFLHCTCQVPCYKCILSNNMLSRIKFKLCLLSTPRRVEWVPWEKKTFEFEEALFYGLYLMVVRKKKMIKPINPFSKWVSSKVDSVQNCTLT